MVNSPPDGYTLLFLGAFLPRQRSILQNLPFNLQRDIAPVSGLIDFPMVVVAHPSVAAKNVAELIANAKANPRKITMASFGTGSASHLAGELFKMMAGIDMVHVPYRGGAADDDRSDRWTGAGRHRRHGNCIAANPSGKAACARP